MLFKQLRSESCDEVKLFVCVCVQKIKRQAQTCTNIYSGMEKKIQNISYVAENDFKSTKMQYIDVNDVEMNL